VAAEHRARRRSTGAAHELEHVRNIVGRVRHGYVACGTTAQGASWPPARNRSPIVTPLFRIARRFLVITVVGCLALFVIVVLYGLAAVGAFIFDLVRDPRFDNMPRTIAIVFKLLDLFLIAAVLYIVALGLATLFLGVDTEVPKGFHVGSLHELKVMISEAAIVVMAVAFLGDVLEWERGSDILFIGGGVALVTAALVLAIRDPPK
jgi:uncharacterized membrane protein YqhA